MNKYIPNSLTFLRLLAIPFFVLLYFKGQAIGALFVFVGACITDYYDGMLARKHNTISKFGKLMDPLADKILVITALILLSLMPVSYLHWSIIIIISAREIAVSVLRHVYIKKNIVISADLWGKIKTIVQMTGIIAALTLDAIIYIFPAFNSFAHHIILVINYYFWGTAVITILSGLNYFIKKYNKGD